MLKETYNQEIKYNNVDDSSLEFQSLLDKADIGIMYLDNNMIIRMITDTVESIIFVGKSDVGSNIFDLVGNDTLLELVEIIDSVLISHQNYEYELTDMYGRIWLVSLTPYDYSDKTEDGVVVTFLNITKMKNTEFQLEVEKEKYRLIAEITDCGLWEYDINSKVLVQTRKLNGRYTDTSIIIPDYRERMLKWGKVYPEDAGIFHQFCDSMDQGEDSFQYDFRSLSDNDEFIWMRFQGTTIKDLNGQAIKVLGKTLDVDADKKDIEYLMQKAERDALTNLYNITATKEKINRCIERNKFYETHVLYVIDIDNFKMINDTCGHLYGDFILEEFAKGLRSLFLTTDVIGRVGGDEFIVFAKEIQTYDTIYMAAETILNMVKDSFSKQRSKVNIAVSIGITIAPSDGITYDELFQKADLALYYVKRNGKSSYEIYNNKDNRYDKMKLEMEQEATENEKIETEMEMVMSPYVEKRLSDFALGVLSGSESLEDAFLIIFNEIGKYYGIDRINIFEKDVKTNIIKVNYDWCNENIEPAYEKCTVLATLASEKYYELFSNATIINCEDISNAKISLDARKSLEKIDIKAFLQCALYDGDEIVGSVNFGSCGRTHNWSKSEIDTLTTITKIIEIYILRLRSAQQLSNEIFFTQAMVNNQMLINYAIKKGTYELQYMNEYTGKKFPNIKMGEQCYKAIMGREEPCETCPIKGLNSKYHRYSVESYDEKFNAWYSITASSVKILDGEEMFLLCRADVTNFLERVQATDRLTGILTLSKFEAEAMKKIARENEAVRYVIVNFDIDKFTYINSECGYEMGDEVLKVIASCISEKLEEEELFSRVTGDNFMLLLKYQDEKSVITRYNDMIEQVVEKIKEVIPSFNVVIISGIYYLTRKDKILSIALDKASVAKKTKKGYHKSRSVIYNTQLKHEMEKEKEIENQMMKALKNNEFIVFFQPKIDLKSRKMVGAEALVRWEKVTSEIIRPMDFVPVFEKNGFIVELDFYVYEEVFCKMRRWMDEGKEPILISVNVSRAHIFDVRFVNKIRALVKKYKVPTKYIELELTETAIFDNMERLIKVFNQLRELGFIISIDDFGSGFSSLNLLKNLPVDILKLDKEFFMQNIMEGRDKMVVSSIIQLAKGLGLKVVSEGVETKEQADFLTTNGCDMAQGFLFYKPLRVTEFEKLL